MVTIPDLVANFTYPMFVLHMEPEVFSFKLVNYGMNYLKN